MALDVIVTVIFAMIVGFGTLYLSFKREGVMWSIMATVIFAVTSLTGLSAPFVTDAAGLVVESPANYLLFGLGLFFSFFSLLQTIRLAFGLFTKK